MKFKRVLNSVGLLGAVGAAGFYLIPHAPYQDPNAIDPRTLPKVVSVAQSKTPSASLRSFTGTVASRVQSNLGFRVPGMIVERMVEVGEQVTKGQALMRIDDADLRLAQAAKRNVAIAAKAVLIQAKADEQRYATLMESRLTASPQRYEQAKAALDTAMAQLAAAEADATVAENATSYAVLVADSDGTIVETAGDTGQVVAAGQTVVQLARAGPREAKVWLPETMRPAIGSTAEADVYGSDENGGKAYLRQISDAADPQTRTYDARFVLEGAAASAVLGSTVTIKILESGRQSEVEVPVGAILNDGDRTGVWLVEQDTSTVTFSPVEIQQIREETALVTGIGLGADVVALGAHLLADGEIVRTGATQEVTQ